MGVKKKKESAVFLVVLCHLKVGQYKIHHIPMTDLVQKKVCLELSVTMAEKSGKKKHRKYSHKLL